MFSGFPICFAQITRYHDRPRPFNVCLIDMEDLQHKFETAKARYQQLRADSQNPHADPLLKSLQLAIARLEKQLEAKSR